MDSRFLQDHRSASDSRTHAETGAEAGMEAVTEAGTEMGMETGLAKGRQVQKWEEGGREDLGNRYRNSDRDMCSIPCPVSYACRYRCTVTQLSAASHTHSYDMAMPVHSKDTCGHGNRHGYRDGYGDRCGDRYGDGY